MSLEFDVVVIGGGLVGAALARELAGTDASVALVEARCDVGDGTSKANTAILHTGFDAKPGTLESRLVARGYELLGDYAARTGIPVERTGALLVAWTDEELAALPGLRDKAVANGYDAYAVRVEGESTILQTPREEVRARWVINAAGLGADAVDGLFGYDRFTVTPRRGELLVYDKLSRPDVPLIVLPVPSAVGKGVLISPTIYGNVMLGPTSEDLGDKTATGTSEAGFAFLLDKGRRLMPSLIDEEVTASYAGLRAAIGQDDYLIEVDAAQRYVLVGGIRSTGLTASMSIAEHVRDLLSQSGFAPPERDTLPPPPLMPNLGEAFARPYQDGDAISADPAYGTIVCFCERVTAGEIRDAFASDLPPADLDGLRRRTRVMNGRCQGFYCGADVRARFEAQRSTGGDLS